MATPAQQFVFKTPSATGFDVFTTTDKTAATVQKLNLDQFKALGLNVDLIPVGIGQAVATKSAVEQKPGSSTAPATPFSLDIPEPFDARVMKQAQETAATRTETLNLLKESISQRNQTLTDIAKSIQPTEKENQLREQLLGFQQAQQKSIEEVQERPLDGTVLTGGVQREIANISQGRTRESLINIRNQTFLTQQLGLEEAKRTNQIKSLELKLQGEQANTDDLFKMANLVDQQEQMQFNRELALNEFQTNLLDNLVSGLEGLSFTDLELETQNKIKSIANQTGVPLGAVVGRLEVSKNKLLADKAQQDFENKLAQEELEIKRLDSIISNLSGGTSSTAGVIPEVQSWVNQIAQGNATIANVPEKLKTSVVIAMDKQGVVTLSDPQRTTLNSLDNATAILDQLETTLNDVGLAETPLGRFTIGSMLTIGALLQTDEEATLYNSQKNSLLATLARSVGERGVLTDQDVERAREALPSLTDTASVASGKLQQFKDLMQEFRTRSISNFTGNFSNSGSNNLIDLTDLNFNF